MSKFEVLPKDIDYLGISWWMRVKLRLVGTPLINDEGKKWGYFHNGIMYITAYPVDSDQIVKPE